MLTDDDAVALAAGRGAAMAQAAAARPTGMSAVLGGDADEVAGAVGRRPGGRDRQRPRPGRRRRRPVEALDAFAAAPPAGARVRPLDVAGAFHTCGDGPRRRRASSRPVAALHARRRRSCAVVANADGAVVADGRELLDRLVAQLTGPVRFDLCLAALADAGARRVVELAPGGTLAAMAKRALPDAAIVALKGPDDLATAPTCEEVAA